jgi:hypothetical protein
MKEFIVQSTVIIFIVEATNGYCSTKFKTDGSDRNILNL